MSDDDTVLLNLPGNEEPLDQLWAFVSVDEKGQEGLCGMTIGNDNFPMITGKKTVLANMRVAAQHVSKKSGKPVRLVRFSRAEVVETITAGMN